jgi:hypothetical protein
MSSLKKNNSKSGADYAAKKSRKSDKRRSKDQDFTENRTKISYARDIPSRSTEMSGIKNSVIIRKKEFIKNIVPTDPFSAQKISFNPGLVAMFPWLSGVAPSFEKYKVRSLRFIYETAQSSFVPGMIMMAPEFNVNDSVPESKAQLLEYAFATRGPVWKNFQMVVPSNSVMNYKEYYIRINEITGDKMLYDPFYLVYATDAVSTDITYAGELWVEYEIELLYPQRISTSVLTFNGYFGCHANTPTNADPFSNFFYDQGGLLITKNDSHSLKFGQDFTGQIIYLIDVANIGLATRMYQNPPVLSLVSDSGTIALNWSVGGSGGSIDPDYVVIVGYIKNVSQGDLLNVNNLGFYVADSAQVANNVNMRFQVGYTPNI